MHTKTYKASFILDTHNYNQPTETIIERLKTVITSIQGEILNVLDMGDKALSRVTKQKFTSGRYVQIDIKGPGSIPQVLKEKLRLDKTINRILIETI
ncbi:MAG: 30S ribosomal protein S6 [Verrucomicrobia bacterium GWF2_51_19]|nr:MAG: 30S ribosomal protein S6 [Verrucomicrobia bacterium GWF2_51_19]HCJ12538.1 30S ribosomal protein S6 [Opitutae bacterium]